MLIDVHGRATHVRVQGPPDAPVLLLLHALGANLTIWDRPAEALARTLRVVRYDLRGHGQSAPGPATDTAPLTIELLAHDALAVLDALGIDDTHVGGVSVGGMVAQAIAAAAPQRVRSLTLCNTLPLFPAPVRAMWRERAGQVRAHGLAPLADAIVSRWVTPATFATPASRRLRHMLGATVPATYAAGAEAIAACDLRQSTAAIRAPTLVLAGDSDLATPADAVAAMAATIHGARFTLLAQAAHLPMLEQPLAVSQAMQDFLADLKEPTMD